MDALLITLVWLRNTFDDVSFMIYMDTVPETLDDSYGYETCLMMYAFHDFCGRRSQNNYVAWI